MFDQVTIAATDRAASEEFFETVLGAAGIVRTASEDDAVRWRDFTVVAAGAARPATRGLHLGFAAGSRALVDAFWRAGRTAGYRDDGAPGPRPHYTPSYYGAFLLDPDGNSAEAVHRDGLRADGTVDHLWIRVADLAAASAFYAALASGAGYRLHAERPERSHFSRTSPGGGAFSVVAGEPTRNVHLAFPAADPAMVASARDPDGNLVELVDRSKA